MRHCKSVPVVRETAAVAPAESSEQRRFRRLEAFAPHYRQTIADIARTSPALEDLADTFPALLFALASGYGTAAARKLAIASVVRGKPLRAAAAHLDLPLWLRKLPAHAFQAPLLAPPADPELVARLVNLIPQHAAAAAPWLERLLLAHHCGGPALALWTAQHYRGITPAATSEIFLRILAWAWHAGQHGLRAADLLTERWTPGCGLRRAAKETHLWLERIALDVCLGAGIRDCWLHAGAAAGYDFVPLRTADDFIAEARAMDNCLDRYSERLLRSPVRVFSIRRQGHSIANVEIATHDREPGIPSITQLRAPRNRRAPMEVWQAAYAWLGSQPIRIGEPSLRVSPTRAQRRQRLELVWRPFLSALPQSVMEKLECLLIPPPPKAMRAGKHNGARRTIARASSP